MNPRSAPRPERAAGDAIRWIEAFPIVTDGGVLRPEPDLDTRSLAGDGVSISELLWGVSVWLALPWLASGRAALARDGFRLDEIAVDELYERAREHGLIAALHRLGVMLRCAWVTDARAPYTAPEQMWSQIRITGSGMVRVSAVARASCEQATAELYGYFLVQDCAIFDITVAPVAAGLWGSPLADPADAGAFSPADARALYDRLRDAGHAAASLLARPVEVAAPAPPYLPDRESVLDAPFPRAAAAIAPSFALPLGLHGFHSGWRDDADVDPRSALGFTSRRIVRLRAAASVVRWADPAWRDGALPLLIKHADGAYAGVTSGAGGALVPFGDRVLKLKRCGYKYLGIQAATVRDRKSTVRDGRIYERSYLGTMGLGEIDDLLAEHEASLLLAERGIPVASHPRLLLCLPHDQFAATPPAGCMITEVVTDVRADEVFVLALGDRDAAHGREVIRDLGRAIGGLYRSLHDARIIRGNGNSWYGNDALCADGAIALCDLEGIVAEAAIGPTMHRLLRELDVHMFRAGVLVSCGTLGGDTERALAWGEHFLDAFDDGYRARARPRAATAAAYVARHLAGEPARARQP